MASDAKLYRVFIASPGGLAEERRAFRNTLTEYNDSEGIERGVLFLPVGWELTLSGVGRPQELINSELRRCDYFVLMLWDRWGSPTSVDARFTSGAEEEYAIAWECFNERAHPMRQLVVLFKSVDPRQLTDPGPQLQKVLKFRAQLEQEKRLLFDTFDEIDTYRRKLRRHLAAWIRDHEEGRSGKVVTPQQPAVRVPISPAPDNLLDDDTRAELPGLESVPTTDQETALAHAVVKGDVTAILEYGRLLAETGRLANAKDVLERGVKEITRPEVKASTLLQLADISLTAAEFQQAEQLYAQALEIRQAIGSQAVASVMLRQARLKQATGAFVEAEELIRRALATRRSQKRRNPAGIAYALYSLAAHLHAQSRYREAAEPAREALHMRQTEVKEAGVVAISKVQVGHVAAELGDYDSARTLIIDEGISVLIENPDRRLDFANASLAAANLFLLTEDYIAAENHIRRALMLRESLLGTEHHLVAQAVRVLGDVLRLQRKYEEAEVAYRRAIQLRERRYRPEHPFYAGSSFGLGRLYLAQGAYKEAAQLLSQARLAVTNTFGPSVVFIGLIDASLAELHFKTGQVEDAKLAIKSALSIFCQELGESHPLSQKARYVNEHVESPTELPNRFPEYVW
jgi:tetratricopeptide (TPR) repeat protein